jgi:acyl carrier protein
MTENEMILKINELLSSGFEIESEKLVPQALLKEDLGLDSLDAVDMLVYLEDNFNIKVAGDRLVQIKTIDDVYQLVKEVLLTPNVNPQLGNNV